MQASKIRSAPWPARSTSPALSEDIRDAPVPGLLAIQDVIGRDPLGEPSRTHDFDPPGELSDEDGPGVSIIPM
jgi:hypothetical protein